MNKKKTMIGYGIVILFLAIFQAVYHLFSHGVTSIGLKFVWAVPLVAIIVLVILDLILPIFSNRSFMNAYNAAVALLANELIFKGILDIAGGDSPYLYLYFVASGLCLLFAIVSLLVQPRLVGKHMKSQKVRG